jgi:hypothetical protein
MKETLDILVHDAKFWAAVVLLVNVVLYYFVPTFPVTIWTAIDGLLAIVFAVFCGRGVVVEKRSRALARSIQA